MRHIRAFVLSLLILAVPSIAFAHSDGYYNFQTGDTSKIVYFTLQEPTGDVTAPTPISGKVYSDAAWDIYYAVDGGTLTQIPLVTQTANGAYSSGGLVLMSDTLAKGRYRLDLPNAILTTAGHATVFVTYNDLDTADIHIDIGSSYRTLTDATTQVGQGTPSATASMATQINYLYKAWRNKWTNLTGGVYRLYNDDATTVDQKATIINQAGRGVVNQGEVATGP